MSAIGSSVVNKSTKKVAPKAPPRRRLGAASAVASGSSPRLSLEPSHEAAIGELVHPEGTTAPTTAAPLTAEVVADVTEPIAKRRKLGDQASARASSKPSGALTVPAVVAPSNKTAPAQPSQLQPSGIPLVFSSPGPAGRTSSSSVRDDALHLNTSSTANGLRNASSTPAASGNDRAPGTDQSIGEAGQKQGLGYVNVVPYEVPRQTASQITWNLRTGKTTDEAIGPERGTRKSARRGAQTAGEGGNSGEIAAVSHAQDNGPSVSNQVGVVAATDATKSLRKGKGREKKPYSARAKTSVREHTNVVSPAVVEEEVSQERAPRSSARLANRDKRKQRATEQLRTEGSILTTIEAEPMTGVFQHETDDNVPADAASELGETHRGKPRRPRASTPEGSEAVQIVPSVVTMFELSARSIRTGWKSEREKSMAQIDWGEVKRRRRAEESALAQQPRPGTSTPNGIPNLERRGGGVAEESIDEDDLDEQLNRAVARNKRKQQSLKIRLVNGEHVVDEASQVVDRHALAKDENEEAAEEVEEDDLTKKFNTQSLVRLRRKDPAERVRNWDPWTTALTDRFYNCLRKFGTDFMVIARCFPGRTRREIKAKFVREERDDPDRVHDALTGAGEGDESWNLDEFKVLANLSSDNITDPRQLEAELQQRWEERQREIEEQKRETAEVERQKQLAGVNSGDEAEAGAAVSDAEPPPKSKNKAGKGKKKRTKKRKGYTGDGGDEEEILGDAEV